MAESPRSVDDRLIADLEVANGELLAVGYIIEWAHRRPSPYGFDYRCIHCHRVVWRAFVERGGVVAALNQHTLDCEEDRKERALIVAEIKGLR